MTVFEYIMVLTSILIGLGIAEILGGIVRVLRSDFKENIYIPQIFWASTLFLHLLLIWWSRWDLRDSIEWNFIQLLLSLTGPIIVFILAGLIFPHNQSAKTHFYKQKRVFYFLMLVLYTIGLLHELIIEKTEILSLATILTAIMMGMVTWASFSKKDYVHIAAATVCLSSVSTFIFLTTYVLYS